MSTIGDIMSPLSVTDALFSRTRSGVFRELFANRDGLYMRELERRIGVNSRQLTRELHVLRDAGILTQTRIGNIVVYQFNPDCPIHDELQGLVRKTVGLADVLRNALEPFREKLELAYIFGSFARGEQRSDSDVDVMIVGSVTRRELSSATRAAGDNLKREINLMVYTPDEYAMGLADNDSFIHAVHVGARINLVVDSARDPRGNGVQRRARSAAPAESRDQPVPRGDRRVPRRREKRRQP
ncbi:MAG: helix-turn-helix domain-containing protein [Candidatus Bipolaricaulis sp.]|nr:helix-turn-helix domain-containing protein [Candidatus Bipolaricaulis sp.]